MYKIKTLVILNACIALFFSSLTLAAETEPQRQSIEALGELNGIALHCKYMEHVHFIKQSLVETLPKKRRLGDIFEEATNTSFLTFIQSKESCPSPAEFDQQVNAAIDQLYKAFLRR
jgi:hypothetical protein